eukprot:3378136-Rhodomonas_salina.4
MTSLRALGRGPSSSGCGRLPGLGMATGLPTERCQWLVSRAGRALASAPPGFGAAAMSSWMR